MVKFNKVEAEKEFPTVEKLGIGKHLTQVSKVVDTKKVEGNPVDLVDKNGIPFWLVIFKDKEEKEHAETFFFGGSMAWKTKRFLVAIGEMTEDEDLETCGKDFTPTDAIGAYLSIEIEEDLKATKEEYKYRICKNGFEAYGTKAEPKKEVAVVPF